MGEKVSRTSSLSRISTITSKVLFLWTAHRSPTHHKLSFNITREVCSYLTDKEKLISFLYQRQSVDVKYCDDSLQWRKFSNFQKLRADYGSSATFIDSNKVFLCGGGTWGALCTFQIDDSAYVLEATGAVLRLPKMGTGRQKPGVIYDSLTNAVYIFGGLTAETSQMSSSEKCKLTGSPVWQKLPNMHESRSSFKPCMQGAVIYLCGGCTATVETYNIQRNEFALLYFTLPEASICTAVITADSIVVVSFSHICKWSLKDERIVFSRQHPGFNPWSSCTPKIFGSLLYIVNLEEKCQGISLKTGKVKVEISLR